MLVQDFLVGGRFRLDERIATGGMAEVWRALDTETGRPVAVKLLVEGTGDPRRFAAEVRALSRVSHPAVVQFCSAGDHHGRPYLVMDLVEGETLADRVAGGPLPPEEAARIGGTVAGALAAAHRLGIVHRDVKPGNVLLDERGGAHLADFGISRLAGAATITGSGWMVGTAGYLAPEQVGGGEVGPAADVYALGLVLLECLTGTRAFPGGPVEAVAARMTRDPDVSASLPHPWPGLLAAMTARDPAARPTARTVADALGDPWAAVAPPVDEAADATRVLPVMAGMAAAGADATVAAPLAEPTVVADPTVPVPPLDPHPTNRRRPPHVAARPARPASPVLVGLVVLGLALLALLVGTALVADDDGSAPATTVTTAPPTTAAATTATTAATTTLPATTEPPPSDEQGGEEGGGRGNGDEGGGNGDEGGGNGDEGNEGRGRGGDD